MTATPSPHALAARRSGSDLFSTIAVPGAPEPLGGLLSRNLDRFGERAMYRERHGDAIKAVTWQEFAREVAAVGRFLEHAGVGVGDRVAVFSPNRSEMLTLEFATAGLGAVYVPVFSGYAAEQAQALAEHASPTVLVVVDREQLDRSGVPDSVSALVGLEPGATDDLPAAIRSRVDAWSYPDILRRFGPAASTDAWLERACGVDPFQPCLMLYTSGTTGLNKGVLLTHDNLLSQQRALSQGVWSVGPSDRFLSYLPWHHSFGGNFEKFSALANGALLVIDDSRGRDFDRLLANWREVQPTIYFSVPKLFQQLVSHVQAHPADEAWIFHPGLRFVFTAAAPLPGNIAAFLASKGVAVQEGWGLTETAPCCTVTDPGETRSVPGMVGYPIPGVHLRFADDGEILVKGPNVMTGYFRNPEATEKALPGDGWFHTGDLGEPCGNGLRLVTRKDRVFKLLNAEKVAPTVLEQQLAGMNAYIRHVIVAGDGRSFLSALIFPDFFRIEQEFGSDREAADRAVKASLRETLVEFNQNQTVPYERIQAFALISKELTVEEQELTPSLKVRFRNVLQSSAGYLEAVYEPTADCDCRFLRKVMRLGSDQRRCFLDLDRTLDECHACANFVFGE